MIGVPFDRLKMHWARSSSLAEEPEPKHDSTIMKTGAVNFSFERYPYFFGADVFAG